jgi:hypothetical protein
MSADPNGLLLAPPPAPGIALGPVAVGICVVACPIAAYAWYQNNASDIQDWIDAHFREPAANDSSKPNCPSDDNYCKWRQQQLTIRRARLAAMVSNGIMPPFQYAQTAKAFNSEVAKHNKQCPKDQVAPLPLGAGQP